MDIKVIQMDITKIGSLVDCIVNAANESLLGGGGVDGAIHEAAGPELYKECLTLHGCKPGEAKATKAYRLPQKFIIHTVGPRYWENKNPKETLRNCYKNSLELADKLGCTSIAFPSIATGIYGYPIEEAAEICAETVFSFKGKNLKQAYMCVLSSHSKDFSCYEKAFSHHKKKETN